MGSSEPQLKHLGVNTLFYVPGDVGGTETYLRELLLAIADKYPNLKLTLFTHLANDIITKEIFGTFENVQFICLPFKGSNRPLRIICEQLLLPFYVKRSKIDILWSPGYTAPFFSPCLQAVTIHDLQYKSHPDDLTWLERFTLDLLVRSACRRCGAVIAVSEFSKSEIVRHRFAGEHKVFSVLEGVDTSFSQPVDDKDSHSRLALILPENSLFILCVAHSYPHKNVDLLVDAFDQISDRINHNLVIVGKKRLGEPRVQAALERCGVPHRIVRLHKGVEFDQLRLLYQKADLFVLPSSYEGFGLPVLEAMMAGTPVVAAKMASIPEVGGEHVIYPQELSVQTLSSTILQALECDRLERDHNASIARRWARTFTWNKGAKQTIKVLEDLYIKST